METPVPSAPRRDGRVPIPLANRFRYWRTRLLPLAVWLVAVAASVYLLDRERRQYAPLPGLVESRQVIVSPLQTGTVESVDVRLFQPVAEGDIVARMDGSVLLSELETARAELARQHSEVAARRAELLADEEQRRSSRFFDLQRAALADEEARLDVLDREAALQIARVEEEGLSTLLGRLDDLLEAGVVDAVTYEETLYAARAAASRVRENQKSLEGAMELRENATRYRVQLEEALAERVPDLDAWLAPLEGAIDVQEARLGELEARLGQLTLRAPASGRVTSLDATPGQTVPAGMPVAVITPDSAERILVYFDEARLDQIATGTEVEILSRRPGREPFRTRISESGAGVELLPERLWLHSTMPRWGMPALIEELPPLDLRPGELLDIRVVGE